MSHQQKDLTTHNDAEERIRKHGIWFHPSQLYWMLPAEDRVDTTKTKQVFFLQDRQMRFLKQRDKALQKQQHDHHTISPSGNGTCMKEVLTHSLFVQYVQERLQLLQHSLDHSILIDPNLPMEFTLRTYDYDSYAEVDHKNYIMSETISSLLCNFFNSYTFRNGPNKFQQLTIEGYTLNEPLVKVVETATKYNIFSCIRICDINHWNTYLLQPIGNACANVVNGFEKVVFYKNRFHHDATDVLCEICQHTKSIDFDLVNFKYPPVAVNHISDALGKNTVLSSFRFRWHRHRHDTTLLANILRGLAGHDTLQTLTIHDPLTRRASRDALTLLLADENCHVTQLKLEGGGRGGGGGGGTSATTIQDNFKFLRNGIVNNRSLITLDLLDCTYRHGSVWELLQMTVQCPTLRHLCIPTIQQEEDFTFLQDGILGDELLPYRKRLQTLDLTNLTIYSHQDEELVQQTLVTLLRQFKSLGNIGRYIEPGSCRFSVVAEQLLDYNHVTCGVELDTIPSSLWPLVMNRVRLHLQQYESSNNRPTTTTAVPSTRHKKLISRHANVLFLLLTRYPNIVSI